MLSRVADSVLWMSRYIERAVRDTISSEMWEQINRTYWTVRSASSRKLWEDGPHAFYQQVKEASQAFQGITDATMLRGQPWQFVRLGRYLERADNTSRLLVLKIHTLMDGTASSGEAPETVQWVAVLKSCSGYEAYLRFYASRIQP